jgi:pyridoxal 5'-phosphate synthase pdxT subunit
MDVPGCGAVIIPGGESTTIGKLMARFGLLDALRERIQDGMPVFGTCAGAILLATEIVGSDQERLGTMPISVRRNAYGRQVESFEAALVVYVSALHSDGGPGPAASSPITGVFIRAPMIVDAGSTTVLAEYEDHPVLVRSVSMLAATFHPELTDDDRVHRYFLRDVAGLSPG